MHTETKTVIFLRTHITHLFVVASIKEEEDEKALRLFRSRGFAENNTHHPNLENNNGLIRDCCFCAPVSFKFLIDCDIISLQLEREGRRSVNAKSCRKLFLYCCMPSQLMSSQLSS